MSAWTPFTANINTPKPRNTDMQCQVCGRQTGKPASLHIDYPGKTLVTYVLCSKCIEAVEQAIARRAS